MAWYDDTDALVIARALHEDLRTATRTKSGGVKICAVMESVSLLRLQRLIEILEADSITCTCKTRPRGRRVHAIVEVD
jgi:hypothetical protein